MNKRPGTFVTILSRELLDSLFNPLVIGALAVMAVCTVFATILSCDSYLWNLTQYFELTAPRQESQTANLGITIAARPLPLQVFAKGPGEAMSRPLTAMRQLEAAFNIKYNVGQERRQRDLILSLADDIDPLFVFKLLLPVLAMFISHAMISGEKETGTLRMMLANSLGRSRLLAAKLTAGALVLLLSLVIFFMAAESTIWLKAIDIPAHLNANVFLIMLATYIYGLLFLLAGAAISTLVHRSDLAMLGCLGLWVLTVIVAPGLAAGMAEVSSGAPPPHLIYARKLALERAVRGGDAMEGDAAAMREANKKALTAIGGIDSEFFDAVRQQEQAALNYGLISPALDYQVVVTTLAQSGLEEERELMRQVRRYFLQISEFDETEQQLFTRTKPDELPRFVYKPLPLSGLFAQTAKQWGALGLILLLLLWFSFWRFGRYDVR